MLTDQSRWWRASRDSDAGSLASALPSRCRWRAGRPQYGADTRAGSVAQGTPPQGRLGEREPGGGRGEGAIGVPCPNLQFITDPPESWEAKKLGSWVGGQVFSSPETQISSSPGDGCLPMGGAFGRAAPLWPIWATDAFGSVTYTL